jgi:molybdopterin-guanine dinucleotide biosynthesis protein
MAEADLDAVIRQTAKLQHKTLTAAVKARRARYLGLAAKAKNKEAKARFKQMAKDTMEFGTAAAKRLQVSADNAADSYARSMRNAAEVAAPMKKAVKKEKD